MQLGFICPECGKEANSIELCYVEHNIYSAMLEVNNGELLFTDKTQVRCEESEFTGYYCPVCGEYLEKEEILKGITEWIGKLPVEEKAKLSAEQVKSWGTLTLEL